MTPLPAEVVTPLTMRLMRGWTAFANLHVSPLPAAPPTVSIGGTDALGWQADIAAVRALSAFVAAAVI
jgi:hypothetical protein